MIPSDAGDLADLESQNRIDTLCDAFENDWRAGKRPQIEEYLTRIADSDSTKLLVELVQIEVFYRRRAGETPQPADYVQRFPELSVQIAADFEETRHLPLVGEPPPRESMERFDLLEMLGQGAFGCVWKARDARLDRVVAIKIPRSMHLDDASAAMFIREAQSAARLRHQNIVTVFEAGREGTAAYIVSEYIAGKNLKAWLTENRPSFDESARICIKLAEGLQHAHDQGVIHRDLKPANIILDQRNEPHITDFGLAKLLSSEWSSLSGQHVLGTPAYMSPEQAAGESGRVDARSDIYSLGVILYEMLTGKRAFEGDQQAVLRQVLTADPPAPRQILKDIPRDLETICLKAMARDRELRYASAQELADDLNRHVGQEPIHARLPWKMFQNGRWSRRQFVGTVFSSAALMGSGIWIGVGRGRRDRNERRVELTTVPEGARVYFIPLSKVTGEPQPGLIVDAGRSPVDRSLAPGDYLVEAVLDDRRFHEVYRHVPEPPETLPGGFAHQGYSFEANGVIALPKIRIPPSSVTNGMAVVDGAAEFAMGKRDSTTVPLHHRSIPSFFMDPLEFTFGQFRAFHGGRLPPHLRAGDHPDNHAVPLSFDFAMTAAEWLGRRLPEEAEYEFAATAGGRRDYPWDGDAPVNDAGARAVFGPVGTPDFDRIDLDSQVPIFGLCSNVAEWMINRPVLYPGNGSAVVGGVESPLDYRVVRGGTSNVVEGNAVVSNTTRDPRDRQTCWRYRTERGLGFRCVRSVKPRLAVADFVQIATEPSDRAVAVRRQ